VTLTPIVLAERLSRDGRVRWQARIGEDRGRLEVIGVVEPSTVPTIIEPLTEADLRELLTDAPTERPQSWLCGDCATNNDRARRWCRVCSAHPGPRNDEATPLIRNRAERTTAK